MSDAKARKQTRADLKRRVMELEAQLVYMYHAASHTLDRAGTKHLMGSGVLLRMNALGGREITVPIVIRDGLSDDTIEALQRDIARSYELATAFKPKGVA
ncbi:MAG TPA: hypothetical protein PKZ27_02965 [Rhodocyclaceae bacterium]|nr:hypothetical protein [Burkholderiaceae bacterium]HRP74527.1 hypothetical protein [Rhodocyclaceae bacterium]